jgi:hypothetical protein
MPSHCRMEFRHRRLMLRCSSRVMFVARVAVGEFHAGTFSTRVPDRKPNSIDRYHSTVNCTSSPSVFVTYHDAQALPEYLVTFSKETDLPGALGASGAFRAPVLAPASAAASLVWPMFSLAAAHSYGKPAKRSRRPRRKAAAAATAQDIVPHDRLPGRRFCKLCSCLLPNSDSVIAKHVAGKRHKSMQESR